MSIVSTLRLDRWQDEDDPNYNWWQRLLLREEYVVQEGNTHWETSYDRNPHWSAGHALTLLHWGLGVDVQIEPCIHCEDKNAESEAYVTVRIGPLDLWVTRRSCPNRPNVFESWTSRIATPSPSASSSESSSSSGG